MKHIHVKSYGLVYTHGGPRWLCDIIKHVPLRIRFVIHALWFGIDLNVCTPMQTTLIYSDTTHKYDTYTVDTRPYMIGVTDRVLRQAKETSWLRGYTGIWRDPHTMITYYARFPLSWLLLMRVQMSRIFWGALNWLYEKGIITTPEGERFKWRNIRFGPSITGKPI